MFNTFEATGNFDDWPKNVPGNPTHAAVFGLKISGNTVNAEILWTGKFPDLEPAMYWAAKKEMQAVRKRDHDAASRVLWQHDLTPEQAVEACRKQMEPQLMGVLRDTKAGIEPTLGDGPMKEVDPSQAEAFLFAVEDAQGRDVVPPFFVPLDDKDAPK
jgi:hypothetical protein